MAKGMKSGGRKQGTPNQNRKELIELLNDKYPGYHPVIAMADIANNAKEDKNLIFQANKEVAKYFSPQLKAVEVNITEPVKNVSETTIFRIKKRA